MKEVKAFLAGLFCVLTGCSGITTADYRNETPRFDIRQYLNGRVEGWGVFEDIKGKVTNRFYVLMETKWQGNVGTLKEYFTFHDGKKQERVWTITMLDDNNFEATAEDVIGKAKGQQNGNAVNMKYILQVPVDGKTYNMDMDDWMYMLNDEIVVNRTSMKKLGVKVGELSLFFKKIGKK